MRLDARPNSRAVQAAPIPGLAARSHSRTASEPRPGRLVDGVLDVDGAPVNVEQLPLGVGVEVGGDVGAQR
eukprot:502250-Alexandrium_andersonii.AAC.1